MNPSIRVFFGHDFFGGNSVRLADYRYKINRGCAAAHKVIKRPVTPLFGNSSLDTALIDGIRNAGGDITGIRDNRFWPKIDGLIRISDLAIFDLTLPDASPAEINWNVLMELGVALGCRVPIRIIVRERSAIIERLSNLDGIQIDEYKSPQTLGGLVKELVMLFGNVSPASLG